jgi:hypothetical protein
MTKFNKTFELSVEDVDLIETALRHTKSELAGQLVEQENVNQDLDTSMRMIHDLLGRLHNQKVFYRPRQRPYVGG